VSALLASGGIRASGARFGEPRPPEDALRPAPGGVEARFGMALGNMTAQLQMFAAPLRHADQEHARP
jgi:hypothetical protein